MVLYLAIALLILIGAFVLVQNFGAVGHDVAPHIDATALGIVLICGLMIAFVIANFRRHR